MKLSFHGCRARRAVGCGDHTFDVDNSHDRLDHQPRTAVHHHRLVAAGCSWRQRVCLLIVFPLGPSELMCLCVAQSRSNSAEQSIMTAFFSLVSGISVGMNLYSASSSQVAQQSALHDHRLMAAAAAALV